MNTIMTIADLLNEPEGKTLEFKRDLSSMKPILKTLVAFANTAGGSIIIGVEDDGKVCGIPDVLQAEERITSSITDNIHPMLIPEIEIYSHEGKSLLIIRVPHWRGPFYLKSEGPEKGVYIRIGSTSRQANGDILTEMRRSVAASSYDQQPLPELSIDDLNMNKLQRTFNNMGRELEKEKLESLGILVPYAGRKVVTIGGAILFANDQTRERFFPDARVSCARFIGHNKAEFLDRLDIEGGVMNALDEVPRFVRRNTRMAGKIETMRRRDTPEYPELAVREALINAIVHADYSITGTRIMIAIYDDRMEIQNPGLLPFGMTFEDFKSGVSKIRNRVIARVFRELNLIEEWGSGYQRITTACQEGGYPQPEWEEFGVALRVTFFPHPGVNNRL